MTDQLPASNSDPFADSFARPFSARTVWQSRQDSKNPPPARATISLMCVLIMFQNYSTNIVTIAGLLEYANRLTRSSGLLNVEPAGCSRELLKLKLVKRY